MPSGGRQLDFGRAIIQVEDIVRRSCRRADDVPARTTRRRAQLGLPVLLVAACVVTLRALFALGYTEEADAFVQWMHQATRLTWPELQVVHDVFGETNLREQILPHVEGYARSSPVRIGNDAHGQLQMDVYGEVIDAVSRFVRRGGHVDRLVASCAIDQPETRRAWPWISGCRTFP